MLFAQEAVAQKLLEDYKKPLPNITFFSETEFNVKTDRHSDVPYGDKSLSYQMRIPKGWITSKARGLSNFAGSSKIMGEVARFYGPPRLDFRSYFTLEVVNLEYQITAEQWFFQYLMDRGHSIQGMQSFGNSKSEALYVVLGMETSYAVRGIAFINGKRIVLAQYFIPLNYWEDERQMQAQVIDSFNLTNLDKGSIEEFLKYDFLDIASLEYPESWTLKKLPLRSIDRMGAKILNVSTKGYEDNQVQALEGRIDVDLVSYYEAESLESEIKIFKANLEKEGLSIHSLIETKEDYIFHDDINFAKTDVFKTENIMQNLLNYELWITIMGAGEYYYFLTLLTPSREDDYNIWVRNTQAYKVVVERFKPLSGAGLYE